MAQYTGPDPNTLLPGDPWTSALAQAAFEDPIAIAEGAPGAPRANGKMAATSFDYATANPLTGLSPGNLFLPDFVFEQKTFANTSTDSSTFQSAGICEISDRATGVLRFQATQVAKRISLQSSNCEIRILKNSSVVELWSLSAPSTDNTTTSAVRVVDISASSGDIFEWQVRRSGPGGSGDGPDVDIQSMSVRANDTYTTRSLPIKASE